MSELKKICVIGAGTMGAGITALIANSRFQVILLDILSQNERPSSIAEAALSKIQTAQPSLLASSSYSANITTGNLRDDLHLITSCDLVIEAIIEDLDAKHALYEKIIPYLKPRAILASNTSTLALHNLKAKLNKDLLERFIIIHFFNPPRYMDLVEVVTDKYIKVDLIKTISNFLIDKLGKTIIQCHDTPGFIANRVGCFFLELTTRFALANNLQPEIVDAILHKYFGMPATGAFGLYDLIGLDVMSHIAESFHKTLPTNDQYRDIYIKAPLINAMLKASILGKKTKAGFYRIDVSKNKQIIDILSYDSIKYNDIDQKTINQYLNYPDLKTFLTSDTPYSRFFTDIMHKFKAYVNSLIPIVGNAGDIDKAMRLGYSWRDGPFALFDKIEDKELLCDRNELLASEFTEILESNNSASFIKYKGHYIFLFHSKQNCLNTEIFTLLQQSIKICEAAGQNLFIYSEAPYFSAGADINHINACLKNNDLQALDDFLKLGQETMQNIKYASVNIVSVARGYALGGGCELLLHSDHIIAHQNLRAGLSEASLGLIPAFGGVKELILRANGDNEILSKYFDNIVKSYSSSSAEEFAQSFDCKNITVVMNKNQLLDIAIKKTYAPKTQPLSNYSVTPIVVSLAFAYLKAFAKDHLSSATDLLNTERSEFIKRARALCHIKI